MRLHDALIDMISFTQDHYKTTAIPEPVFPPETHLQLTPLRVEHLYRISPKSDDRRRNHGRQITDARQ